MNILVTGAWREAEENLNTLEEMGMNVLFLKNEWDSLPCEYNWVEAVICNSLFLHHPIERFENLRYIQLTSAGMDRVPVDYINEHGIKLFNAKGVYSIPVAEFVLSSVLNVYKATSFFYKNQKKHIWVKKYNLMELSDKNVCILGCGEVGTECAKRFKAFGCTVIGVNRTVYDNSYFDDIKPLSELNECMSEADIIVISIALTNDTVHMINKDNLQYAKNGAVIVNVSRGKIINNEDLLAVIQEKDLKVVLDVFENEPLKNDDPLWETRGVYLTPHNSYSGDHNNMRMKNLFFSNLEKIITE